MEERPNDGLPQEVATLVESGVATWLATCGSDGQPTVTPVVGARNTGRTLTLYVPAEAATESFEDLRTNEKMSVFFCRVTNYSAVQIKGRLLRAAPTSDEERAFQKRCLDLYVQANVEVGVARELAAKLRFEPSVALEMSIDEVFVQTPGPQAGNRWQ